MHTSRYFTNAGPFKAGVLAEKLGLTVQGDAQMVLADVAKLQEATPSQLSFYHTGILNNTKYEEDLKKTEAGAVICKPEVAHLLPKGVTALVTDNPHAAYAKAWAMFYPDSMSGVTQPGVHPKAMVDDSADIAPTAQIDAGAYIGPHVHIGEGTHICSNVVIQCAQIGRGVIIHPNVSIGQDGFGFAPTATGAVKVPQLGGVIVEDGVEIGANTTIDRGSMGNTVIGMGTKIDNLVQIAHNVKIGRACIIVGQAGIAGSTTLGDGVIIGGQAGVAGHLEIASGTQIAARSGVTKSITQPGQTWGGFPAQPMQDWRRSQAKLARLIKSNKRDV